MRMVALRSGEKVIPTLQKALEVNTPFDICIADISMPGVSGYEVAKQIRHFKSSIIPDKLRFTRYPNARQSSIRSLPLIALSSLMERDARKCEEAGFDGFLSKPIRKEKLYKMMERLLGEGVDMHDKDERVTQQIMTQYTVREDMKNSARILLAEDNPVNQKLAKILLTKAGYHVEVANNGKEAVEKYMASPKDFDLIFMDIQMPEMDGLEATREIRKFETGNLKLEAGDMQHQSSIVPDNSGFTLYSTNRESSIHRVPIVAMTAHTMKGDREKCLEAGMDDYITKPIKRELVFDILEKWIFNNEAL